jgi:hypothetical protein
MPKRPDVWPRYKTDRHGKRHFDSFYFQKLRLKTKDAGQARDRVRLHKAGKWPPKEEAPAAVTAEAFTFDPPPASSTPPSPPASSAPEPSPAPAQPITGDWTAAAAAASAETKDEPDQAPPAELPQISSEQLADLVVSLELKGAEVYIQKKVYEAFVAPTIAPEGRAILTNAYRTIFDYGGAAVSLPPWVHGVVVPALTVVISSMAIVSGFRDAALEQKRSAEGGA